MPANAATSASDAPAIYSRQQRQRTCHNSSSHRPLNVSACLQTLGRSNAPCFHFSPGANSAFTMDDTYQRHKNGSLPLTSRDNTWAILAALSIASDQPRFHNGRDTYQRYKHGSLPLTIHDKTEAIPAALLLLVVNKPAALSQGVTYNQRYKNGSPSNTTHDTRPTHIMPYSHLYYYN